MGVAAPTIEKSRLHFLDAARGLAAAYVVLYHLTLIPEPDLRVPQWLNLLVHNGGMGVTLFFVVSAFSLCYTMPARFRDAAPWLSFAVHRIFRIAPLFYLWIALTLYRDIRMFGAHHSASEVLLSSTFLFNLVPGRQEGFVWASWTIGIEMLFYAVFPVFYWYAKDRSRAVAFVLLLLVGWWMLRGLAPYWPLNDTLRAAVLQWSFLRHLPVFALGVLAYHVFTHPAANGESHENRGRPMLYGGIALLVALVNGWLPDIFGDAYYWQGIAFALVLLGLAFHPTRVLVNRVSRYLGRISYSLYLNHPTLILLLEPVYTRVYSRVPNLSVAFLACAALTFGVAVAVSEITFRLVEQPGINLGKRVNRAVQELVRGRQATAAARS